MAAHIFLKFEMCRLNLNTRLSQRRVIGGRCEEADGTFVYRLASRCWGPSPHLAANNGGKAAQALLYLRCYSFLLRVYRPPASAPLLVLY